MHFRKKVGDGSANSINGGTITNQGTDNGTITWNPTYAGTYYYDTSNNLEMSGVI